MTTGTARRTLTSVRHASRPSDLPVLVAVLALACVACGGIRASETNPPPAEAGARAPDAASIEDAGLDVAICPPHEGGFPGTDAGPTVAAGFYAFAGQMVLDGQGVVLTCGGVDPQTDNGALIRTTPNGGAITVLAQGTADLQIGTPLAADDASFYFSAHMGGTGPGSIYALDRSGGVPRKLADTEYEVVAIAVDATRLYWTEYGPTIATGSVRAVPLACGAPVVLAPNQDVGRALAVDATRIYWGAEVPSQDAGPSGSQGVILSMPLAGGAPTTLVTAAEGYVPYAIAFDGPSLFWAEAQSGGLDCVGGSHIVTLPGNGSSRVVLASVTGAGGFVLSPDAVYYADYGRVPCGSEDPTGLGDVAKVPRAGGPIVTLASGLTLPTALVLDGASLDFAEIVSEDGAGAVLTVGN